jgi:hypothetical protein
MTETNERESRRWWRRRWILVTVSVLVVVAVVGALAVAWGLRQLQPLMRRKVVETLSARFHSPVELDRLELSVSKGVIVTGGGLRILYLAGPTKPDVRQSAPPMLSVESFEFRTGLRELLRPTTRVVAVKVNGVKVNIPPKGARGGTAQPDDEKTRGQSKFGIAVDRIDCTNARVTLETSSPGKEPLVFEIERVTLTDVGAKKPLNYEAVLMNPKPVGLVESTGRFGPWQGDNPRDTPLEGTYAFTKADLSSIHGIAGTLASTGKFAGTLGEITVDGISDTPDFRLDISDHPMFLHAEFHAVVDGTTGDTRLDPVVARLGRSGFTARGEVVRVPGQAGRDLDLHVVMDKGQVEDVLSLVLKANPPLLRGGIGFKAHVRIPPGPVSVSRKIRLEGTFAIDDAVLSDAKMREKMDTMSMRAQGKPRLANAEDAVAVTASAEGKFSVADAVVNVSELSYQMPGVQVKMEGEVKLVPSTFEFHGVARTEATASQMTTGWKSMLVKPFDRLLKKNGAGVELPIKVTGTGSTYDLRLDFPHDKSGPGVKAPEGAPTPKK